ncbi:DUF4406 domain-containing protein [Actinomyces bowdenii]|uniref:DUF4406 domain-containing protein n=1 Tax=Actinomyces bowdenii TaxID=131109 RepID=UPI00214B30C3|nr:DUF4406 domain-containing protein [Actinomyces bowdenii]MCR2051777.1 DUF4406 domain-containing protein [Actinomyces bowdenii]
MRKRVYIAGPITGVQDYERVFKAAVLRLKMAGHHPVSPTAICAWQAECQRRPGDTDWMMWMRTTAQALIQCDGVALLPGWRESRGAMVEADWAEAVGLPVRELEEWLA